MGNKTGIEWTDKTWNPWHGCIKVSPGCKNCYMYREKKQYGQDPTKIVRSKTTFNAPLKWHEPAKVFTCSWSDFFIAEADAWRPDAWDVIRQTPHLTYQILTKRPERMRDHLPDDWPLKNVWLGVSIESEAYIKRVFDLIETKAAIKFVSLEPLLGPITFYDEPFNGYSTMAGWNYLDDLDWVIVGGESGPNERYAPVQWIRDIVNECKNWRVPVFVKQDSGARSGMQGRIPDDLWLKQFPEVKR